MDMPGLKASILAALTALAAGAAWAADPVSPGLKPVHGLAMHGDLKYGPDFKHFDYVNPNAPKGGLVRLSSIGTYDTLNPFTLKGVAANLANLPFETLMAASADEPFSEYGLIAESVEVQPERKWVIFNLRPEARFHDGTPVTAEDVAFSLKTLREKGHPTYRLYFGGVKKVEILSRLRIKFSFGSAVNRELPLIIGQLPVLPKHYWAGKDFAKTTLTPPLGGGPYKVVEVDPGRSITYERVKDYWGRDLPVNKGKYNFERIRVDYYRDSTVALEALKSGEYDLRDEHVSKQWATGYVSPAIEQGLLKKIFLPHHQPTGMQAFVFNTRKPLFKDPRVRAALTNAFDFEWTNRVLFYGAYARTESYFSNSDLAAKGLPSPLELKILEPFKGKVPPEVFTTPYRAPSTGSAQAGLRRNLLTALEKLKAAGWTVRDGKLVNAKTGSPLKFEILLVSPNFERIALPFIGNLRRLGVEATLRTVDTSQYVNRLQKFDFDMIVTVWGQSLSPGNEQSNYWTSAAAGIEGSRNFAGIRDPVVDRLVEHLIAAPDRATLVATTRALDRVLLWGHYVIPHWHIRGDRLAFWDKFGRPAITPIMGYQFLAWWIDKEKEASLQTRKATLGKQPETAGQKSEERLPWGWIAGGAVVIIVLILMFRRRSKG